MLWVERERGEAGASSAQMPAVMNLARWGLAAGSQGGLSPRERRWMRVSLMWWINAPSANWEYWDRRQQRAQ